VPATVDDLLDLLRLSQTGPDTFVGRHAESALQRVFGGQVAAQAITAADETVAGAFVAHSLQAAFLRPGQVGRPIRYQVERVREGRAFATRRVLADQDERPILALTASYHVPEQGFDHADVMPDVPPPESCPTMADVLARASGRDPAGFLAEWAALDVRYAGDSRPGGGLPPTAGPGSSPARARVWLRTTGKLPDDPRLHAAILTYASDLTLLGATVIPHGTFVGAPGLLFASVDHALWLHRPVRADGWILYDQVSPSASAGVGFATGRMFSADGTLAASVAQEGLIRMLDADPETG
jgi:acyl-CoA thioesterase-2